MLSPEAAQRRMEFKRAEGLIRLCNSKLSALVGISDSVEVDDIRNLLQSLQVIIQNLQIEFLVPNNTSRCTCISHNASPTTVSFTNTALAAPAPSGFHNVNSTQSRPPIVSTAQHFPAQPSPVLHNAFSGIRDVAVLSPPPSHRSANEHIVVVPNSSSFSTPTSVQPLARSIVHRIPPQNAAVAAPVRVNTSSMQSHSHSQNHRAGDASAGEVLIARFCRDYSRNIVRNGMETVYVLKLANNKYYVGKTKNLVTRLNQHMQGGAQWTRTHRVESLIEVIQPGDPYEEDQQTLKYMAKYGIENVRGGSFSRVELSEPERSIIRQLQCNAENRCFNCGGVGHFSGECRMQQAQTPHADPSTRQLAQSRAQRRCFHCGKTGHYSYVCTLPQYSDSSDSDSDSDSDSAEEFYYRRKRRRSRQYDYSDYDEDDSYGDYSEDSDDHRRDRDHSKFCTRCGRDGHTYRRCYAKTSRDGRKL